jgi:hypothetical protein
MVVFLDRRPAVQFIHRQGGTKDTTMKMSENLSILPA